VAHTIALPPWFWERVDMNGPVPRKRPSLGPCWLWTGKIEDNGYAQRIQIDGERDFPHRFAYRALVGPIPDELESDHICHSSDPLGCLALGLGVCLHRRCLNAPSHMELVTHAENMRRARRLVCPQGHPYDGDNLYVDPRGRRICRACNTERQRAFHAKRLAVAAQPPPDARCKYGHPYDVDKQGRWYCKECGRKRAREFMRRKRAGGATPPPPPGLG
jgi:hypothetical protein